MEVHRINDSDSGIQLWLAHMSLRHVIVSVQCMRFDPKEADVYPSTWHEWVIVTREDTGE
jgi:hypothetical protein